MRTSSRAPQFRAFSQIIKAEAQKDVAKVAPKARTFYELQSYQTQALKDYFD